jgi:glycosyltransferase involved in cell wall biosynthesis
VGVSNIRIIARRYFPVRDLEEDLPLQGNRPPQPRLLVTTLPELVDFPMRILVWYWGRRGAGAQIALAMAAALDRRPDTSVYLSISRQCEMIEEFRNLQIQTQEVDTYQDLAGFVLGLARVPLLTSRLVRLARDWQADAVVSVMTHTWTPLVAPSLARAGIAFVPIIHDVSPHPGDNNGFLWNWRLWCEIKAARAAFTLSDYAGAGLRQYYADIPLLRLPLGAFLSPVVKLSHNSESFRFLFFGRFRAYKGLDLLRDAFRLLVARRPAARLIVVGEGDVLTLAPGLDATPGVEVWVRWVPEAAIGEIMAGADAVVVPYREASQSGVISAAFVGLLPVVATPVGGIPEQVMPGINGIIATAVTPEAFADAMERMMDPLVHRVLLAGAAEAGRRLSDWDSHAAKLLEGLRTIGLQSSPA